MAGRVWVHVALACGTVAACLVAVLLDPSRVLAEPLSLGLGYVALLYLAVSLLIGPVYLLRRRRNPVNIYLRRDIGIWAGITSLLHVAVGFQVFEQGQILLYFFSKVRAQYLPQLNLFGLSNYVGLLAAIIALVLLVLSNDLSLRWLKGKRWKTIQRFTYPLIVLAILHTFGYQINNARDASFIIAVLGLTLGLAVIQGTGAWVHLRRLCRRAQRRAGAAVPATRGPAWAGPAPYPAPYLLPQPDPAGLSRRRFLVYGGATILAGLAGLVSFRVSEEVVSHLLREQTAPGPVPAPPVAGTGGDSPPTATVPAIANEAAPATTAPDNTAGQAVAPTDVPSPTIAPTASAGGSPGVVLATLATCPLNSALNFTTPDTGAPCILIHEADGSIKAFSNVCTHRPYPVEYDGSTQTLVCPLHLARFNAATGQVTEGPARRALPPIPVHVDAGGNIIYG